MIKSIKPDNKIFNSKEFQKDKYKFLLILQKVNLMGLELSRSKIVIGVKLNLLMGKLIKNIKEN